jgi:hypothetical protein
VSSLTDDINPRVEFEARQPQGAGLYLFDLDDTIVYRGSHISDRVLRALGRASEAGIVAGAGCTAYNAVKFAVVGLSHCLREELACFGIQVCVVCPGPFRTDFRDNSSMKHAKTSLAAYEGSAVHAARDFLTANNHKQEGDPAKAAAFLYSIIESGKLPKRILIGKKCCEDVKAYLEERISEIESYLDESSQTDFDVE